MFSKTVKPLRMNDFKILAKKLFKWLRLFNRHLYTDEIGLLPIGARKIDDLSGLSVAEFLET